jgi:EAL and modified HD-GYP domain-containing signal transduction protein
MAEAAAKAGCKLIPKAAVHCASGLAIELPALAKWIAGDWYLAPPAKPIGAQAASRTLALQLVQLVAADADTHEIEAVLRRDPTLSYHLLRVVNSLGMGMSRQITSFSQAILILGRAQLRRWLNLMLFSSRQGDERSAMLLSRVAVRARIMELLAKYSGMDRAGQDSAFMAGMFSLLGVLFGMPLAEVLRPLKISDALSAAVLGHQGDLGHLLKTVECVECRDTTQLTTLLDALQVPYAEFSTLIVQAHVWMLDVIRDRGGVNV